MSFLYLLLLPIVILLLHSYVLSVAWNNSVSQILNLQRMSVIQAFWLIVFIHVSLPHNTLILKCWDHASQRQEGNDEPILIT
jgi:hypothetical protein